MRRVLLVGLIAVLSGCAPARQPTAKAPAPRPSPPRTLHTLVLASPTGQGMLEMKREIRVVKEAPTVVYSAGGAIVAVDDIGQWRFAYTRTSLEGAGLTPGEWIAGLHAMSMILTSGSPGPVEIEWEQSSFLDPSGRSHRIVHRGVQLNQITAPMPPTTVAAGATLSEFVFPAGGVSFSAPGRASLWNSPAVFERLAPGAEFSIVLSVKSGGRSAQRAFRFSAGPRAGS